jgi:hypothetical protein
MPRVRRVPRIRHGWPPGAIFHLLSGHDFFGDGFGEGDAFDEESARAAWFELRDRVESALAERRRATRNYPLLRPVAWWWFEAPEPRDYEVSEAEQLERLGLSYEIGEVPSHDGSDNGRQINERN